MTDSTSNSNDQLKKHSRRNWLRNAAIVVTSAFMLSLTGCTKEVLDMLPGHGGGGLGSTPDQRYNLKATYGGEEGYMSRVFGQGIINDSYMEVTLDGRHTSKIRLHPAGDGWAFWELQDGTWLSLSSIGWLYRSDSTNRVAWKIVDGKLYNLYWDKVNWQEYPAGSQKTQTGDFNTYPIYYIGVNLGDENVLTNCKLVPIP